MDALENPPGGSNGSPKGDRAAAARAAGDAAATGAGTPRKDPRGGPRPNSGRPRNDGRPPGSVVVEETPPPSAADIEFFRETAESLLRLVSTVVSNKIDKAVRSIDPSFTELADKLAGQVEISEEEIKFMGHAAGAIGAKYAVLTRFTPEIAIVGSIAIYGIRLQGALKEVKALTIAVNKARGGAKPKANPEGNENQN